MKLKIGSRRLPARLAEIARHTWPFWLSALLSGVGLWPQLLHAAPAKQRDLHVLSWLRGARVKPADETTRDRVRQAAITQPYLPRGDRVRESPSVSDQEQALGLAVSLAGGAGLYYDLHFAVLARIGAFRYRRAHTGTGSPDAGHPSSRATIHHSSAPPALAFIPGNRLELGLRFCEGCTLSLGRRGPNTLKPRNQPVSASGKSRRSDARLIDRLSGGHGPLTGVHLSFAHPRYGGLAITPLYRPELSGSFFAETEPGQLNSDRAHNWQRDFVELASKARSYAHRATYTLRLGPVLLGFDYALHRQDDTANPSSPPAGSRALPDPGTTHSPASGGSGADRFRHSVDHIAYAGFGLAIVSELGQAYLNLQRSSGAYRTLLAAHADGPREARIEGVRLSSGFTWTPGQLRLRARFTLPEPERAKRPGETRYEQSSTERSGYIGFGNVELNAPVLRDTLDFLPAPRLCPNSDRCSGIEKRSLRLDSDRAPALRDTAAFRDHAAVFEIQVGHAAPAAPHDQVYIELGLSIFAPLAPRPAGGRNPFQRLKKDPLSFEYREFSLRIERQFGDAGTLEFGYSRLYRRHRATGSLLAGESLRLGLRYHL